jgi:hypothetical protein
MKARMRIQGGQVLADGALAEVALDIDESYIASVGREVAPGSLH